MPPEYPPDVVLGIQATELDLCLIRSENFVFHGLKVLQVTFPPGRTGLVGGVVQRWEVSLFSTNQQWSSLSFIYLKTALWLQALVPNFFLRPLCLLGPSVLQKCFLPPDLCVGLILSQRSAHSWLDFTAWFVLWHALSIRQVWHPISWISHQSRDTSQIISGNRIELTSSLSVVAKAVNTFVILDFCV